MSGTGPSDPGSSGPGSKGAGPDSPGPSRPGPEADRTRSGPERDPLPPGPGLDPALRLGIQLPPAPTGGDRADRWLAAAAAAEDAGFGTVWVAGNEVDPCTLAGGLSARTGSILLGVVAGVGADDRLPSVLARELSALDVVSGGRATVLLEPGAGWERVAEAAEVCRLLFTEDAPSYRGRHFHLAGAANRPVPVRPGGPPVLLAVPGTPPGRGAGPVPAAAWVVDGTPEEVAAWRGLAGAPAVVWRGTLGPEVDAARTAARLRKAGAAGAIVRLTPPASPEAVAAAGRALVAAWAP